MFGPAPVPPAFHVMVIQEIYSTPLCHLTDGRSMQWNGKTCGCSEAERIGCCGHVTGAASAVKSELVADGETTTTLCQLQHQQLSPTRSCDVIVTSSPAAACSPPAIAFNIAHHGQCCPAAQGCVFLTFERGGGRRAGRGGVRVLWVRKQISAGQSIGEGILLTLYGSSLQSTRYGSFSFVTQAARREGRGSCFCLSPPTPGK